MAKQSTKPLARLRAARDALATGDPGGALGLLLALWQATPDRALAAAIEIVGARAARGLVAPTGPERKPAWRGVTAVTRHVLFATIRQDGDADQRLAAIANVPDPRLATCVLDLLETPPPRVGDAFWIRMLGLLPLLRDPRVLARVRELPAAWSARDDRAQLEAWLADELPAIEAAFAVEPQLTAIERAIVDAIAALAAPDPYEHLATARDAELLAAVYASPADDNPRMVYADHLMQRGDPRGEMIALQLAADRSTDQAQRTAALVAEHGHRWLGPLAAHVVASTAHFERGFVARCELAARATPAADAAWATVSAIHAGMPATDACPMPLLREATGLDRENLARLAGLAVPPPIERLGIACAHDDVAATAIFARLALPHLRRLELTSTERFPDRTVRWAWKPKPIVELAVVGPPRDVMTWLPVIEDSKLVVFELVFADAADDWRSAPRLVLARDEPAVPWRSLVVIGERTSSLERALLEGLQLVPARRFDAIELPRQTDALGGYERHMRITAEIRRIVGS